VVNVVVRIGEECGRTCGSEEEEWVDIQLCVVVAGIANLC